MIQEPHEISTKNLTSSIYKFMIIIGGVRIG